MGGKKKKRIDTRNDKRLDVFLSNLEIEKEKKEQIINYVEELTQNVLIKKNELKLRLNKGE
ncbi:hypothetical protein HON71_04320 [Candidatus Woesearchaeota archaeon]|nr:hypothetical protein [Candidatus Woesearchaeota archaeon]MBT5342480.1 hypothetical protein [Candidatus Woesearchaeota archaeon]